MTVDFTLFDLLAAESVGWMETRQSPPTQKLIYVTESINLPRLVRDTPPLLEFPSYNISSTSRGVQPIHLPAPFISRARLSDTASTLPERLPPRVPKSTVRKQKESSTRVDWAKIIESRTQMPKKPRAKKEKSIRCPVRECPKRYSSQDGLRYHCKTIHNDLWLTKYNTHGAT